MESKAIKAKRQAMIGRINMNLIKLYDNKTPEQVETIDQLTRDICMIMHQYATCAKGWDEDYTKVNQRYENITKR